MKSAMLEERSSVLGRVLTVVVEVLSVAEREATENCDIREDLVADSLDMVSLVWALEEEFGGKIEDDAMESLKTPGDITDYVYRQMTMHSQVADSG